MALALCVLWIAGFELLPWLHIALHDHLHAHHHDASGATIIDDDGDVDEHVAHHDDDDDDGDVDEHVADHEHGDPDDADEHVAHHHADHNDRDVEHAGHHAHHAPANDPAARLAAALAHGEHSLAHHGIAVPTPAPVLTAPLPVDRRPTYLVATAIGEPPSFSPGRAVARGPPDLLFG